MKYPTSFQLKAFWTAVAGVSLAVIGALILGFIWLFGSIFAHLQSVLLPLIVAGIVAYVCDPIVRLLQARGMSRLWAVITLFLGMVIAILLLAVTILPGLQRGQVALRGMFAPKQSSTQTVTTDSNGTKHLTPALARTLTGLKAKHEDGVVAWLLQEVDDTGRPFVSSQVPVDPESLTPFAKSRAGRSVIANLDQILDTGRSWLTTGSSKVLNFLGLLLGMVMVPIYLFFFLKESASIEEHWHDYVPIKASRFKTHLVETLQEINGYLVSFFRGQVLVAAIDGVLVGLALTIFGLPYGFIIGVFMAVVGVIPFVGNLLCLIPACIIAYLHAQSPGFGMSPLAYTGGVVAIFVIVQQINSLVTAPKIVGDSVGLHPMTVIFSMLFWSLILGGFVGALIAVPLTAAVKVLFRRFIWERSNKEDPQMTENACTEAI